MGGVMSKNKLVRHSLKKEYKEYSDMFNINMLDSGCTCFIRPPCPYCTHEGNPLNLNENDDAWNYRPIRRTYLSQDEYKFYYEYKDGKLYNSSNANNKSKIGKLAGTYHECTGNNRKVYNSVKLNNNQYMTHVVIWIMHNGDVPDNMCVDHIDGNRYNNKIENLRLATHSENSRNRKISNINTTGYKGVYKRRNKWVSIIGQNNKQLYLGAFNTPEEANEVYKKKAQELFGSFCRGE
jgi:hypothetical protein